MQTELKAQDATVDSSEIMGSVAARAISITYVAAEKQAHDRRRNFQGGFVVLAPCLKFKGDHVGEASGSAGDLGENPRLAFIEAVVRAEFSFNPGENSGAGKRYFRDHHPVANQ